jgi:hypothetical protein
MVEDAMIVVAEATVEGIIIIMKIFSSSSSRSSSIIIVIIITCFSFKFSPTSKRSTFVKSCRNMFKSPHNSTRHQENPTSLLILPSSSTS